MSQPFKKYLDEIMKSVLVKGIPYLVPLLWQEAYESVKVLSTELRKPDLKKPDFVCELVISRLRKYLLHAEIQTTNDKKMGVRFLDYHSALRAHFPEVKYTHIYQFVIYIGDGKCTIPGEWQMGFTTFRCGVIDFPRLPVEEILKFDFAPFLMFALINQTEPVEQITVKLVKRIRDLEPDNDTLYQCLGVFRVLEQQAQKHDIYQQLLTQMKTLFKYDEKEDILYKLGIEKGIEKGIEQGIEQGIEKGVAETTNSMLQASRMLYQQQKSYEDTAKATGLDIDYLRQIFPELHG